MKVKTELGYIYGDTIDTITRFRGIPYAISPLKTGVFKRTIEIQKYSDIVDATHFANKAPQPKVGQISTENDLRQSIDCLYLNIWAPANFDEMKPVVVWIHGGAFVMGETATKMYDGTSFAKNGNVVYVSIQYRLGIFGFTDFSFFNDEENKYEPNLGLYDQIEALKWIKKNIKAFGGDCDKITVMGESAGASSILCLMTSQKSHNLFHKAILQSPVSNCVLTKQQGHYWANKILEYGGLSVNDLANLNDYSIEKTNSITKKVMESFTNLTPGSWAFGPVIDDDLVKESIIKAYHGNHFTYIPIIIGTNKDEAALFVRENEPWLPSNIQQMDLFFDQNQCVDKKFILSNYENYPSIKTFKEIGRDFIFSVGNTHICDKHSIENDTYVYRFDYETEVTKKMGIGAFHGAEIMYAFSNLDSELSKLIIYDIENAVKLTNYIHQAWINFIHHGNPNSKDNNLWEKYISKTRNTLSINIENKVLLDPETRARLTWMKYILNN